MIGRIRGELVHKSVASVIVETGGVGYEIVCPLTVLDHLPREGEACMLCIHTHVREDQITLFGFNDMDQRTLFRPLTTVTGVGPKLALACLGAMETSHLSTAIVEGDIKRLCTIPGIGKRSAERLALELKDKLHVGVVGRPAPKSAHLDDLESALRNLGYKTREVDKLIEGLREEAASMDFEALLREALGRLRG